MPLRDKPGPMGWWKNEHESSLRTFYYEAQALEKLQAAGITRQRPARDAEPGILRSVRQRMAADGLSGGIDLTYLEPLLFGGFLQWKAQLIGSCVASGGMRAWTSRALWEIVVLGEPEETLGNHLTGRDNLAHFGPYSYRAGRKIGGLNGGDGSFCGAHIEGLATYGALPCQTAGLESDAWPEPQSTSLYRRWGNSDQLLNKFAPHAKHLKLVESSRIRGTAELKTAITEHYKPAMVCSNWAFKPDVQLPGGQWRYTRDRRNSWAHNMTKIAYVEIGGRWYVKIKNSWGMNAHRDGDYFWIPADLDDQWSGDSVCMTMGDIDLIDSEYEA